MKRSLILLLALGSLSAFAADSNQFSVGERVLVKDGNYTGSINSIFVNNTVDVYVDGAAQHITVTINRLVKSVECDKKSGICTGDKVNFGGELVKVKDPLPTSPIHFQRLIMFFM